VFHWTITAYADSCPLAALQQPAAQGQVQTFWSSADTSVIYDLLFKASAETMLTIVAAAKHLAPASA
jgi:hypothetical protein